MWLGRWKLATIVAISECLVHAEAKYCAFEIHGEPKYYVCQRTEYCCNFGCCVSPGFQIYHLWYYWLLVIIMFLVCSGGGWWYRYWLQGRYRPSASVIPTRTSSSRAQNALRGPTCRAQQARVTYNPARNTVLLHRMWKGPQRNATPPAYNGGAASSARFQNTNVVLNDNNCPYYELYGPPPSYETVIAQSRGKIMSPVPLLEHSRSNAQTPSIQNQNVAHCFSHNNYSSLPTRIHNDNGIGERRNSCGSNLEEPVYNYHAIGYKSNGQKYDARQVLRLGANPQTEKLYRGSTASAARPTLSQNISQKLPFCVGENRRETRDGDAATLQNSKSSPDNFTIISANGSAEYDPSAVSAGSQFARSVMIGRGIGDTRVGGKAEPRLNGMEVEIAPTRRAGDENRTRLDSKVSRGPPSTFAYSKGDAFEDGTGQKYDRAQSASLKGGARGVRPTESRDGYCDVHRYKASGANDKRTQEGSSSSATASSGMRFDSHCERCVAQNDASTSELNPSNNVILSSLNPDVRMNPLPPINIIENYQHYPPTSPAQRSASTNFESEIKLGRSRSLD